MTHVNSHNTVWLPWIISILIRLTVQIRLYTLMGKAIIYIYVCELFTHNLCGADWLFYLLTCQIPADDNSSTCAFMTVKSHWWNSPSNNIVFARFNCTSNIYLILDMLIIFSEYNCLKLVNNFILWFYHLA